MLTWSSTVSSSICVMKMVVESLICAPTRLLSTRNIVSVTGSTTSIALTLPTGSTWTSWPTLLTLPRPIKFAVLWNVWMPCDDLWLTSRTWIVALPVNLLIMCNYTDSHKDKQRFIYPSNSFIWINYSFFKENSIMEQLVLLNIFL